MHTELAHWAHPLRERLDATLVGRFGDAWPPRFAEACVYPLQTGGKRIRPLLGFAAARALGSDITDGIVGACAAAELVHTYSLVHDDLPCMDDDVERRGRATVHIAYAEDTAVLVGDALLTEAFRLLSGLPLPADVRVSLVSELADAGGHMGMLGGQAADIGMGGPVTELDALLRLHRGKTGALIRAAVRMGAIAAGASADALESLTTYGDAVGLAFQMADDVLDEHEDAGEDGPPSYVKLMGVTETRARARSLLADALNAIADLPSPDRLEDLARFAIERDH